MRSFMLLDFIGFTVVTNTSLDGSSVVEPSILIPHCPVCELKITFHSFSPGSVYKLYLPAFSVFPPILMSLLVSKMVAWLAPVRHTLSYCTNPPQILRPFTDGLP